MTCFHSPHTKVECYLESNNILIFTLRLIFVWSVELGSSKGGFGFPFSQASLLLHDKAILSINGEVLHIGWEFLRHASKLHQSCQ